MIFTEYANDFWHKRKMYYFNPYNVLLAIATNIPQRLKTRGLLPDPNPRVPKYCRVSGRVSG